MNCLHDFENDDCTNCANGFPPFHCLMDEDKDKKLKKLVHKKAKERELKIKEETLREFLRRCDEKIKENMKKDEYDTALSDMDLLEIKQTMLAE